MVSLNLFRHMMMQACLSSAAITDLDVTPSVTNSHLGVYTQATRVLSEVVAATGALDKVALFFGRIMRPELGQWLDAQPCGGGDEEKHDGKA